MVQEAEQLFKVLVHHGDVVFRDAKKKKKSAATVVAEAEIARAQGGKTRCRQMGSTSCKSDSCPSPRAKRFRRA